METLSPGCTAHSLPQLANDTHPEPRGRGPTAAAQKGVWPEESQGHRRNLAQQRCVHVRVYPGSRPLPWEVPLPCLLEVGGSPCGGVGGWGVGGEGEQGLGQNPCSYGWSGCPRGRSGWWPESGGWVTLCLLHLSGKADENSCGSLPLDTPQGPGLLGPCKTSQMENLQHWGNSQHRNACPPINVTRSQAEEHSTHHQ